MAVKEFVGGRLADKREEQGDGATGAWSFKRETWELPTRPSRASFRATGRPVSSQHCDRTIGIMSASMENGEMGGRAFQPDRC